jgi:hypothetical protein
MCNEGGSKLLYLCKVPFTTADKKLVNSIAEQRFSLAEVVRLADI